MIEGRGGRFQPPERLQISSTPASLPRPKGSWVVNTGPSFITTASNSAVQAARVATGAGKVLQVLNPNLHPDFFGNQAGRYPPVRWQAASFKHAGQGGALCRQPSTPCAATG